MPLGQKRWTTQQVAELAPDARSVAAARKLASPGPWSELGCTGSLVWGRCQGRAATPYQATVDLDEPAFRCTCPSRKQPCKHGLALLLLWVEHGDAVAEAAAPAGFAEDWARQRTGKPQSTARRDGGVADPDAQTRREQQRVAAMTDGFIDLERWLGDLTRQGLASARRQPYAFWDATAARLVDAQLPGLAERVRAAGGAVRRSEDWADGLVAECGRWELAAQAWRRRASLPLALLGDLRTFIGWPRRGDEVAGFQRQRDRWVVAGVRQGEDGRVVSQRTWLRGERSGRWVLVLDFATSVQALQVAHVVGAVVEDELTLYPGNDPVRAAFSGQQQIVATGQAPPTRALAEARGDLAEALARNPWADHLPVAVRGVTVAQGGGRWWLRDEPGNRLPLHPDAQPWLLLALSGGEPSDVVAEWRDAALDPMTLLQPEVVPL